MGHSFGGATAMQSAVVLAEHCAGLVTLATQSAGCEPAEDLATKIPVLMFHGTDDTILPIAASEMVQMILGGGELVRLPDVGHLLAEASEQLREHLREWIPSQFANHTKQ